MATAAPPNQARPAGGALRLLDVVPVIAVTVAGVFLVVLAVRALARLNPAFTAANRETLALTATLIIYLAFAAGQGEGLRSEEHTSELQSHSDLVCRLLLEKKNTNNSTHSHPQ